LPRLLTAGKTLRTAISHASVFGRCKSKEEFSESIAAAPSTSPEAATISRCMGWRLGAINRTE
jgi:hypothetical protein